MKKSVFTLVVIVGLTAISGCVTAQKLTSNVNENSVVYSASAAKNVNSIYLSYSECLSNAFVRISEQRLKNNDLPDMRAKTYEDQCIEQERLLYQAIYSASRDYDRTSGHEKYAHNTARTGVKQAKKMTFEAIAEGFQPPK